MRVLVRVLKVVLPFVVLGVAAMAAVTMIRNRPEVQTQLPAPVPPGVRVQLVDVGTARVSVTSQGTVRPRTESQLVPEISGRVTWVSPSFASGGFFDAGDVLVRIDPFDYQQAVISARSQLAQARLRLAQEEAEAEVALREWEELGRGDPRALTLRVPQLEDARASVAAAEANVVRAERDLERADLTAPYAGRVRAKSVDVGQFVTVGNPVATIYAVDVAEVRLPLPDDELAYLDLPLAYRGTQNQTGPEVILRAPFAGDVFEWRGRVVRTESEIDAVSRMVHVVAEVRDPYAPGSDPDRPPLAVGMFVEAEIAGRAFDDVSMVPRSALRGRDQVLVVDSENRIRFRDIDVLRTTTDAVYVRSGLGEGERVTISPLDGPTDGMLVQVTDTESSMMLSDEPAAERVEARRAEPIPPRPSLRPPDPVAVEPPAASDPGWLQALLSDGDGPAGDRPAVASVASARPTETRRPEPRRVPPPPSRPSGGEAPAPASVPPARPAAPTPPPILSDTSREPVAVQPFAMMGQLDEHPAMALTLAEAVSLELADLGSVTVVPDVAAASLVVGGGVQAVGDTVRVTARVIDTDGGDVVRAIKVDGTLDEWPTLQDEVTRAVRAGILDALGSAPPLAPTGEPLAVRAFASVSQGDGDARLAQAVHDAVTARLRALDGVYLVDAESEATRVVTGGIQRVGNQLRITAQVITVADGAVIHAVKVDGPADESERLQQQVATELGRSVSEVTS